LAVGALGCEEKKTETAGAAEVAAATPEPPPAPAPEAVAATEEVAPAPPKVRKKLEDCPTGNEVVLDNAEMEGALRVKAQKPDGELTAADLRRVRSLNLTRVPLDELDICLFRHMTGLRELFLAKGNVDDLSPIATSTQLESLGVSRNPITDLSVLSKLTKLDRLDLAGTKVKDLSPLAGLTALTELNVDDTPVEDVSALEKLTKLERLSLQRTQVKSLQVLSAHKALKFLYVSGSPLEGDYGATAVVTKNGTKVLSD
jgi:internalin A